MARNSTQKEWPLLCKWKLTKSRIAKAFKILKMIKFTNRLKKRLQNYHGDVYLNHVKQSTEKVINMMILDRYPSFFEVCKKAFPNGGLDFSAMSNSDIDGFVIAYLTDLGGESAQLAGMLKACNDEYQLENAYSSCGVVLSELAVKYNDYCDLIREGAHAYLTEQCKPARRTHSDQAMIDVGHKWSDF